MALICFEPVFAGQHELRFFCDEKDTGRIAATCLTWADLKESTFNGSEDKAWEVAQATYQAWLTRLMQSGLDRDAQQHLCTNFFPHCRHTQLLSLISTWTETHAANISQHQ